MELEALKELIKISYKDFKDYEDAYFKGKAETYLYLYSCIENITYEEAQKLLEEEE